MVAMPCAMTAGMESAANAPTVNSERIFAIWILVEVVDMISSPLVLEVPRVA